MQKTTRMKKIDGEKLKKIVESKGYEKAALSREMGFHSCYLNRCMRQNEMNAGGMRVLEILTGISPEEYKYEEPKKQPEPMTFDPKQMEIQVDTESTNDFWKKLYDTIYNATYEAVKKAWNEPVNIERKEKNA